MSSATNLSYPSQPRDTMFPYQQSQYSMVPPRQSAQLTQQVAAYRPHAPPEQTQTASYTPYARVPPIDDHSILNPRPSSGSFPILSNHQSDIRPTITSQSSDPLVTGRQQQFRSNLPNLLPPLESTVTSGQPRGSTFTSLQ